jgi:transcription antitermination factor NusG
MTFWAVAQTFMHRESYVAARIADAGFEVFAPKTRLRVKGEPKVVALFPGYVFVRIADRWRVIAKTAGVLGLIMSGEQPANCPEAEIEKIRAATMRNGLVRLPPQPKRQLLKVGQTVRIASGSFCGFEAVYHGMSARDRQLVLLTMFGRPTRVELATIDEIVPLETCQPNQIGVGGIPGDKSRPTAARRAFHAVR